MPPAMASWRASSTGERLAMARLKLGGGGALCLVDAIRLYRTSICSSHMKMSASSQVERSALGDGLSRRSWADARARAHAPGDVRSQVLSWRSRRGAGRRWVMECK